MNYRKSFLSIVLLSISSGLVASDESNLHYESKLNTLAWGKVFSMKQNPETVFTTIFKQGLWHNFGSASGPGSDLKATKPIRKSLPILIKDFSISSLLDIPCGDFYWFNVVDLGTCTYIGCDVVKEIVDTNNHVHANSLRTFKQADATRDILPKVDLIFSRDMLVHFDLENVFKALKNFKASGSRYILMTTFLGDQDNRDIKMGDWRALNFQKAPFNFPAPLRLLQDRGSRCDKGSDNKYLGLWRLEDLPV